MMSVLKAAYPSYYRDMKRTEAFAVVGLWQSAFRDEPAEWVAQAVAPREGGVDQNNRRRLLNCCGHIVAPCKEGVN